MCTHKVPVVKSQDMVTSHGAHAVEQRLVKKKKTWALKPGKKLVRSQMLEGVGTSKASPEAKDRAGI